MSFIVRGIKIPVSCDSCPLMRWNDYGIDGELQYCKVLNAICEHEEGQRDADCPLGELPPHGRLIDADALVEQINQSIAEQEKVFDSIKEDPIGKQSVWVDIMHDERIVRILRNAPAIIEAEEAEK